MGVYLDLWYPLDASLCSIGYCIPVLVHVCMVCVCISKYSLMHKIMCKSFVLIGIRMCENTVHAYVS
jgi:hypothetical protein